jgi:hypothetical protein
MVKAKEFWKHLCDKLDHRLFAGVPCLGLNPLYKTMDKNMLHYMPAVNERIAIGIVSGGFLTGFKGGVLLSASSLIGLKNEVQIIKDFNIPMLLIVYEDNKVTYPFWHKELSEDFKKDLDKIADRSKSSILLIREGILK